MFFKRLKKRTVNNTLRFVSIVFPVLGMTIQSVLMGSKTKDNLKKNL